MSAPAPQPQQRSHQPEARLGLLLHIHPRELEAQFWRSLHVLRMLSVMDGVAFAMVLPNMLAAMLGRVNKSLPPGVVLPLGAKLILLLYWLVSMLPVALMLLHFDSYRRHRTRLAVVSRLYRLVASALLTHPATVLGYVTQVAAVRQAALAGDTLKAVLVNTLLPTVLHMQQANCHLSFRLSALFQLGCFVVAVMWAQGMSCWLPLPPTAASSGAVSAGNSTHCPQQSPFLAQLPSSALLSPADAWAPSTSSDVPASSAAASAAAAVAFQQAGSTACQALHVVNRLVWMPVMAASQPYAPDDMCDGVAAFQLLYLFAAGVLLLLVVLSSVYLVEWQAKLHWLRAHGITVVTSSPAAAWQPGLQQPLQSQWQQPLQSQHQQQQPSEQPVRQVLTAWVDLPWFVLVLLPLTLCWLLAQGVTELLGVECAPPLGSDTFAWMRALF